MLADLSQFLRSNENLTPRQELMLALDVSLAVRDIHRAGFVHRDIKPGNVLLWVDPKDELLHAKLGGS